MDYKEWLIAAVFSHEGEICVSDDYWRKQRGKWRLTRYDGNGEVVLRVVRRPLKSAESPATVRRGRPRNSAMANIARGFDAGYEAGAAGVVPKDIAWREWQRRHS